MATVISAIDDKYEYRVLHKLLFNHYLFNSEESASLFSDPPKPWIIYTVYAHLGLVAVLYIIIIVLVIYYHQIVKKTSDKRNTTNPNYYEPNEKGNNMEKKTHELYKREKGVDNHYDVNRKNFNTSKSYLIILKHHERLSFDDITLNVAYFSKNKI